MWSQQQGNKGRRKAESVINGAKDGAKDGSFRHAAGGRGGVAKGKAVLGMLGEAAGVGIFAQGNPG